MSFSKRHRLNPTPDKVHDPKFQDNEFFDPRERRTGRNQFHEMLRLLDRETGSVTDATEEYENEACMYYQNKANFDKGGGCCVSTESVAHVACINSRVRHWRSSNSKSSQASLVRARELAKLIRQKSMSTYTLGRSERRQKKSSR